MKKLITIVLITFVLSPLLLARPQYSILQTYGTKCSNCHVNNNYGGQRSTAGFISRNAMSVIKPEWVGLKGLYEFLDDKNAFIDDKIVWGLDFRYQNARWGQTNKLQETRDTNLQPVRPTLERKGMIMQLAPYISLYPIDWLKIDGMYNFSYDIEPNMRYKGQQPGTVSATFDIHKDLPTIRIGYFPPEMALDFDDHTLLVRQVAGNARSQPLIPADYAELGIQLNYDRIDWLSASFGIFESKNMADLLIDNAIPVVDKNTLSSVFNVSVNSELPLGLIGFLGTTHYLNGNLKTDNGIYIGRDYYTISTIYLGFGKSDLFSIMAEYSTSNKQSIRKVDNFLIEATYQLIEPVNIFLRYETANTDLKLKNEKYDATQYVIGSHIYILPYVDLLPEYRIYDRGDVSGYSSQWAIQLHIFY